MMKHVLFLICLPVFAGCTFSKDISSQKPYSDMIGQCYETVVEMTVYENVCWDLGELVISHRFSESCFSSVVEPLFPSGSKFFIKAVYKQGLGESGSCFNVVVTSSSLDTQEQQLYIPVCWSREYLSWLKNKYASMGEKIELSEEFVVPCNEKNNRDQGDQRDQRDQGQSKNYDDNGFILLNHL